MRKLLIGWSDIIKDYQEEEIIALNNYMNHLKPYEKKHTAFSWDNYKQFYKDPRIDLSFLETLEFENYVRDRHYDLSEILSTNSGEIELVNKTINQIIELSNIDSDE